MPDSIFRYFRGDMHELKKQADDEKLFKEAQADEKSNAKVVNGPWASIITGVYSAENKKMEVLNTLTWKSPVTPMLAKGYVVPKTAEELNHNCLACVLSDGIYSSVGSCNRKDNSAKPVLSKTLEIGQFYDRTKSVCSNSPKCANLDL